MYCLGPFTWKDMSETKKFWSFIPDFIFKNISYISIDRFLSTSWFILSSNPNYEESLIGVGGIHRDGLLGPTFIEPEYRGHGFQRLLLDKRIEFAKQSGLNKVYAICDFNNSPSLINLLKTGFVIVNARNEIELILEKKIVS